MIVNLSHLAAAHQSMIEVLMQDLSQLEKSSERLNSEIDQININYDCLLDLT